MRLARVQGFGTVAFAGVLPWTRIARLGNRVDQALAFELVGYVGSGLVVVSLMMRSLLRLRVVNLVGAAVFSVYGLLIAAPPVWVVNLAIVGIDVYELRRMLRHHEDVEVLDVGPDDAYVRRFLDHWGEDIRRFVPAFAGVRGDQTAHLVLRDLVPAALVLSHREDDATMIDLDYAIPSHRDHTSGRHVYADPALLGSGPVVAADPGSEAHARYLARMGFRPGEGRWVLDRVEGSRRAR